MSAKIFLFVTAAAATAVLLTGCTTTTTTPVQPDTSTSASAAASTCASSVTQGLATDLVKVASCVAVPGLTSKPDDVAADIANLDPVFAAGDTVVYDVTKPHQEAAAVDLPYLDGYRDGKKVWQIARQSEYSIDAAVMVNGVPMVLSRNVQKVDGDAVSKASATYTLDFYTFDGKHVRTVAGVKNSARITEDANNADAYGDVNDAGATADAQGLTGYVSTNDGVYYVDPHTNKISFLVENTWRTVAAHFQREQWQQYAYTANRKVLGYNKDGFLTDDYPGFYQDHLNPVPSTLKFITWAGKTLWSVNVSHDGGNTGATGVVYGNIAHVAYATPLPGGNVGAYVDRWINIETGKTVDSKTIASTVKPYLGFQVKQGLYVAANNAIVYDLADQTRAEDGKSKQAAYSSTGVKQSLDETENRNALAITGVAGNTFYGAAGLRYDADTDKATVENGAGDLTLSITVGGAAYFKNGNQEYYIKLAG